MRFLSMIRADETTDHPPSEQMLADMGQLIDELTRSGQLISTAGLRPSSEGMRVHLNRGGEMSVVDGPFTETKEVIAGFALFEAPSREAALALTHRFLKLHGTGWDLVCEVRQIDDFGCGAPANA